MTLFIEPDASVINDSAISMINSLTNEKCCVEKQYKKINPIEQICQIPKIKKMLPNPTESETF
jgi:hypothetical protein